MNQRLLHLLLTTVFFGACLSLSTDWILNAWNTSPLDRHGQWFFIAGLIWMIAGSVLTKPLSMPAVDIKAIPFFIVALLLILVAQLININAMTVYASLFAGLTFIWLLKGTRIAVITFPGFMLATLSAPTALYFIDQIRIALHINVFGAKGMQLAAVILTLLISPLLIQIAKKASTAGNKGVLAGYLFSFSIFIAGLIAGQHQANLGPPFSLNPEGYLLDSWLGAEIGLSPAEQNYFVDTVIEKRVYAKPEGQAVALLTISSEDIHRLHTPEYCWTGSGWQVTSRQALRPQQTGNPLPAAVTYLTLQKDNREISMLYWFSDQEHSTGEIADLRLSTPFHDKKNIRLFMVSTINPKDHQPVDTLEDFLKSAQKNPGIQQ